MRTGIKLILLGLGKVKPSKGGYSIAELVVVIAILAVLSSLALPEIGKYVKRSRIDNVKSILNKEIGDCLNSYRYSPETFPSRKISEEAIGKIEADFYRIAPGRDKCMDLWAVPSEPGEDYLFEIGFTINAGKVQKIAVPASDRTSESSCKSWGICGVSPELQAEWDRLAKIEADKKACNDAFYTFLNSGSKGQKNVWDDASQSCSRAQWVLDGTRYTSKDAYDEAFTAKVGKQCAAELASYSSNTPPNGRYKNDNCGIDTYFFNGVNLESSDPTMYESKKLEYNNQQCAAAENSWLKDGKAGQFTWPAGLSCTAKWKCPSENNKVFTDQASYTASSCGTPPIPKCIEPPKPWFCSRLPSHEACQNQCKN